MTHEAKPQSSKLYQTEEDSKLIVTNFKKVGHLDITVICSICEEAVHINKLFHHKKAHQAQATLRYQRPWIETIDIDKIGLQRKQVILRMRNTDTFTEREREKVSCSFDFLKETLKVAPYFCIKHVAQSSVHIEMVSNPLIKAIAICQDKNSVWRSSLEDVFVVLDNYGNKKETCFLGVFDGTNGISAAQTTSVELPLLFLDQLSHGDPSYEMSEAEKKVLDSFRTIFRADYKEREKNFTVKRVKSKRSRPKTHEWIHRAYAKSFWRMDRLLRLGRNEASRVHWSSCAAVTCLVENRNNEKEALDQERNISFEKQENIVQETNDTPEEIIAEKDNIEQWPDSFEKQQKAELIEKTDSEKELNITQQEDKLFEEINRGTRKSNTEQATASIVEEYKEKPTERMNEGKSSIQKEVVVEQLPEETGKTERDINIERTGSFIEQQTGKLNERMDEKEQNVIQQEEQLEELGVKRGTNGKLGTDSITILWTEESTERANEEENLIKVKQLAEVVKREMSKAEVEQETGRTTEQQTERPIEGMNEEKEQNVILGEELLGGLRREKSRGEQGTDSGADLWREQPTEKISEENEHSDIHEEMKASERTVRGKEDCMTELEDNEQSTDNQTGIEEYDLLENCPDEIRVGLMHIANIGNVHAVLCKDGKTYWLTKEHSTYCGEEKKRVLQNGGHISSNEPKGLVEGIIKNTRGLGHHGNPKLKKTFIPVPHTITFPIDDSCQFLILATNGLWEVLDKNEVVLLTLTLFSAYLEKYQYDQLKKSCISKESTPPVSDSRDEFYSWYSNQDFFPERETNVSHDSVRLMPPRNSSTKEWKMNQSGSFGENSEEQKSESFLEPPFMDTSSSEYTTESKEETPSISDTQESPKTDHGTSETSEDSEKDSRTFHDLAAKYISKHLVKAALKAGSRDNITVLVALLNGCDKIPSYVYQI